MMGQHQKQEELWAKDYDLIKRIPEDNVLRKLKQILDLDFVRHEVGGFYGVNGQVSVDPVQILKMMLLLFLEDVASERELMRTIPLRIDYLWFLGFSLEDQIPNHSVLSKARTKWGYDVFERLFKSTVEQCWRAGLIDGRKVHVDSSMVRANASLDSVVKITVDKLDGDEETPVKGTNAQYRSTTDPEATLTRHRGGQSSPSYQVHRALDDAHGVITAVETTTGTVNEAHKMVDLIADHTEQVGMVPEAVVADCKYGISANFIAMGQAGIRSHMGDLRARLKIHKMEGIYEQDRFVYDPQTDTYQCPAGEQLKRRRYVESRGHYEYQTAIGVCRDCSLRSLCTKDKEGRTLKRYPEQELLDQARRQSNSPEAVADRKKRQWLVEGVFGLGAVHHGMKRARWRGLWKQAIQDYLIAGVQNLLILLRKGLAA